ncbi:MAG: ABC transporter ATP-binding protein [Halobacteria archaeon]|nr:ABC transporter ATP-binding protein [Halobacteria archaeon]
MSNRGKQYGSNGRETRGGHGDAETDSIEIGKTVLELDGVYKEYGDTVAVDGLTLSVHEGELLTLVGPSGGGKTTTLRLIAGLEEPDSGEVRAGGEVVANPEKGVFAEPDEREVGIVFQDFALFPHMTAEENIEFGLDGVSDDEKEKKVDRMLELVGLEDERHSTPDELSGGQKQRIALARSLAPEPDILLLDEPFSNLDVGLRVEMREEVRRILKEAGVTGVSVTHDQEEALSISDRIGVMEEGDIAQVGRPEEVFQNPESRFVAGFLGHASFISGTVGDGSVSTQIGEIDLDVIEGLTSEYEGAEVDVLVRPDDVMAVTPDSDYDHDPNSSSETDPDSHDAHGEIVYRQYNGPTFIYRVELENGDKIRCMHNHADDFDLGSEVDIKLISDHPLTWYPRDDSGEDGDSE